MRGGNQCRTGSGTDSAAYACNNETEETELNKAGGRILEQDMVAGFDNPPFDRSPVDGYACKARGPCRCR